MTAVTHEDRVVTRDAMVVKPDLGSGAAPEVGDVLVQAQEARLIAVLEREVEAAQRELRGDCPGAQTVIEQGEGVELKLGANRLERFGDGALDLEPERADRGGVWGLDGHGGEQTSGLLERCRRWLRGREEARCRLMATRSSKPRSAGILLHRRREGAVEVLLVHPGGPFWAWRDEGAWSIPKGEYGPDEDALAAARREFEEEHGTAAPEGSTEDLGEIRQKGGKVVRAFALAGDLDVDRITSNTFELEWPPHSGRRIEVPEVDRAEWFTIKEAGRKINPAQVELLERLTARLATP